eukprot:TRINITY_DN2980_c0_g2_i1.p2 TRINITY_DN2980_c0_g2~~TRINITY_DN2980_c0_g2_i1.p2  ORF type:complete len:314 (+),score=41.96 TRINITY_DN2980_c0_g2_i1:175-1116(+)
MNDLMNEIHEEEGQQDPQQQQHQNGGAVIIDVRENANPAAGKQVRDKDMNDFFVEVAEVKRLLGVIDILHNRIHNTHEISKTVTEPEDVQDIRDQIQEDTTKVKKTGHKVKSKLDKIDKMNAEAMQKEGQGLGSSSERTRTSITAGLKKKLKLQMDKFQRLRLLMQAEYRETVERRLFTITGEHASREEIEQLIESGQSERIFQSALVPQSKVADTLQEIEERHRAVKDLEQSLLELHQLFIDMSVLIESQGAVLDSVEKQVERGAEFLGEGTEVLRDARRLAIQGNKYMICVLGVTVVALVFILTTLRASVF